MSDLLNQTKSEIRHLPLMLCKLVGGILVVVGAAGLVLIWTGRSGPLLSSQGPYFFSALLGIVLFLRSSRAMARSKKSSLQNVSPRNEQRVSIVAWSLLLLLVMVFLLITYFVTR
ncbi:MAG: hypothetical protein PHD01_02825 [Geobacteraceae bacterium]|nr:hypothetical protein [Geobacteraceae bacterium]